MEGPRLERVNVLIAASRTAHASGPAAIPQKGLAVLFRLEMIHQVGQRHRWLYGQGLRGFAVLVHICNLAKGGATVKCQIIALSDWGD